MKTTAETVYDNATSLKMTSLLADDSTAGMEGVQRRLTPRSQEDRLLQEEDAAASIDV